MSVAMAEDVMTFGENLQRLRKEAGLSQQGLADKSGIPVNTIQNWEGGRHTARLNVLPPLAKALGVPVEALIVPEPEPPKKTTRGRKPKGR